MMTNLCIIAEILEARELIYCTIISEVLVLFMGLHEYDEHI